MNPLQQRLAALRRRLWLVVTFRGACWVATIFCAGALLAGLADWGIHLPSLVRALVLTAGLAGAGYVALRWLIQPLATRHDDLSLALRVETLYPAFNDALASAVEFSQHATAATTVDSPSLRRETIQRAESLAEKLDFRAVVDARGVRAAALSFAGSAGLALLLAFSYPQVARMALLRLTEPFAGHEWPRQTELSVQAKHRVGRNETFEIQVQVGGVIPERAVAAFRFDGAPPLEQVYDIARGGEKNPGAFVARLESARVLQNFCFQIRANDAASGWEEVEVLPPPQLVPLAGRASPQIHLQFPDYTDLSAVNLPDGSSTIEAIAGTDIGLQAAADRPLARAWLDYPAELESTLHASAVLSAFGVPGVTGALELAGKSPGAPLGIPARLDQEGCSFSLDFPARLSGMFVLRFEDRLGLINSRLIDVHTQNDPAPSVQLERPSPSLDSLNVLADADIGLQVRAEDLILAIRSVYLEYRIKRISASTAGDLEPHQVMLYEHAAFGRAASELFAAGMLTPLRLGPMPRKLRTPRIDAQRRWSLRDLELAPGDIVTIQACADDFDDVAVHKSPGRSHEIDLHVITRTALDILLNEAQARVEQELERLQKQQQEALEKVIPAEAHWRKNRGQLQPRHLDELLQAEQLQQQIRARVGNRQEGLRAETSRILRALRDNHLPRSGIEDRMGAVQSELDRLAREELEQIEPHLTEARKENDGEAERPKERDFARGPLTEARKHQDEVKKTLHDLFKLLEPWSSTHEIKGEAKSILQDQQQLAEQTAQLARKTPAGAAPSELKPTVQAELEKTGELQSQLSERARNLVNKMEGLAQKKNREDPETAQALSDAAKKGKERDAAGKMKQAEQSIRANQLARAEAQERESARALEEIVKALEDRREVELDRLVKKMREAEEKVADLAERQALLQKKARAAAAMNDAQQRTEALKRLAREQEQLRQETQKMLRELSRLRADRAGQALGQAGGRMQRAGERMEKSDDPQDQQEEALDRLNEAKRELHQARADAEDELAREKLAQVADLIKGLRSRQEALLVEAARIHRDILQNKAWVRELSGSWIDLTDAERALGAETQHLADDKLKGAKVFAHLILKASDAMRRAAEEMELREENARKRISETPADQEPTLDVRAEQTANTEVERGQRTALRHIDQLLDAMKPESGGGRSGAMAGGGGQGQPGAGGQAREKDDEPKLPAVAELKALKALQIEITESTREFDRLHPDRTKLGGREHEEMRALHRELQEIRDLYHAVTSPGETEGGNK